MSLFNQRRKFLVVEPDREVELKIGNLSSIRGEREITASSIPAVLGFENQEWQPQSLPETETRTPIISIISLLLAVVGIFIMGIPLGILAIIMAFVADYYCEKTALKWIGGIVGLIDIFLTLIALGMLLSMFR